MREVSTIMLKGAIPLLNLEEVVEEGHTSKSSSQEIYLVSRHLVSVL